MVQGDAMVRFIISCDEFSRRDTQGLIAFITAKRLGLVDRVFSLTTKDKYERLLIRAKSLNEMPVVKASGAWDYTRNGYHISTVSLGPTKVSLLEDAEPREGEVWYWADCMACEWRGGAHYDRTTRFDRAVEQARTHLSTAHGRRVHT